jgi:NIMA (never in mitosis gene a)-related kinase
MLSISPNRIREIHDPCSRILHQLHKILFIAQLPPTTAAAPDRLCIEKYKHALFSRRSHHRGWNLKDELNKASAGIKGREIFCFCSTGRALQSWG